MLQRLTIKNIALVDSIEATLNPGFNVITGETGSGKSLILFAFSFLLGEKADHSHIREGASSATVEATFDIQSQPLLQLLNEAGILVEGSEVIIKRELLSSGKNKVFINNQQAQLAFLKKISSQLVITSNQHAHLTLLADGAPLHMLDTFCDTKELLVSFKAAHSHELALQKEIEAIELRISTRQHEIDELREIYKEIDRAKLQIDEESSLEEELSRLSHVDELTNKCSDIMRSLDAERGSVLDVLAKKKQLLERAYQLDPKLKNIYDSYSSAYTEFKELAYELKSYITNLEINPTRFQQVQERLGTISKLKKKYGESIQDVLQYKETTHTRLHELEHQDDLLEEKKLLYSQAKEKTEQLAEKLTKERRNGAKKLSDRVTKELRELNMPHAIFEIVIEKGKRSSIGDDICHFLLTPNRGEKRIHIKDSVSGGELARLALAFQTILLKKLSVPTILFDEIDANIGGKTATIVGNKLQALGNVLQVISITHFPQVASCADHHFCISKQLQDGRTVTTLQPLLTRQERVIELQRMAGIVD